MIKQISSPLHMIHPQKAQQVDKYPKSQHNLTENMLKTATRTILYIVFYYYSFLSFFPSRNPDGCKN